MRRALSLLGAVFLSVMMFRPSNAEDHSSLQHEIQRAIDRGLDWLLDNQNTNSWWQTKDHPAVTALVLTSFNGDPMKRYQGKEHAQLNKAYKYLLDLAQSDGRIAVTNLPTYNTAVSMLALATANQPKYEPVLRRARGFLASVQRDFGQSGTTDTPLDGGFGYGLPTDKVSDMSNTLLALEAMRFTSQLKPEKSRTGVDDLNWEAAIHFVQSCQNLRSHNTNDWASDDLKNKGGFVYHSGRSNAGSETNELGRVTWRSYGSISYAGMLSYIYANLERDDPRLQAVVDWLQRNFTLDENPGMKDAGLYYYYHTMAKALAAYGVRNLNSPTGEKIDWRRELALKLIQLQRFDGSWVNNNARWWEKEKPLVTSYTILALEHVWHSLEKENNTEPFRSK